MRKVAKIADLTEKEATAIKVAITKQKGKKFKSMNSKPTKENRNGKYNGNTIGVRALKGLGGVKLGYFSDDEFLMDEARAKDLSKFGSFVEII